MENIEVKVDAILRSPLGCSFLRHAETSGLPPEEIVLPLPRYYMCASASWEVEVWGGDGDYQGMRTKVLSLGQEHRDLAISILEQPAAADWFKPVDIANQVVLPLTAIAPSLANFAVPSSRISNWERYAEKFIGAMFTSTLTGGTASIFVAIDKKVGDIVTDQELPYKSWLLKAEPAIRVFEIHGAETYHELCARYPAAGSNNATSPDFSMDTGRITPNWYAVAHDWDAVHVSFGAMLMTDQVRVESKAGWSFNWSWHIEQTLWLRWAFTSVEPLPDHEKGDSPYRKLRLPRWV